MIWHTPRQIAERFGFDVGKPLDWIASGELQAVNVAKKRDGRPRWRISDDALQEFLAARSNRPPPKPPKTPRRRKPSSDIPRYV